MTMHLKTCIHNKSYVLLEKNEFNYFVTELMKFQSVFIRIFNQIVVVNVLEVVHQQTKIWIHHHHHLIEVINHLFDVHTLQVHQNHHHSHRSPAKWALMCWIRVIQIYQIQWHLLWHQVQH